MNNSIRKSETIQKEYYDKISNEYDIHYASNNAIKYRHLIYKAFLDNENFNDFQILDAMCGGGQSTGFFLSRGAIVTGVDISSGQCDNFKKRFPNSDIYCRSILETRMSDSKYDFIITDSLHHIHPNVDKCMDEFYRLLKPSGKLMLWEPSANSIFNLIRKIWYKKDTKYFQYNEAAIDLNKLTNDNKNKFKLIKSKYGGNFGYIFLLLTMAIRTKPKRNKQLFSFLIFIEKLINVIQNKYFALWFLALYEKK